jgi:hypothetical protein
MSYPENHSIDDCDKCLKRVGYKNLFIVPFLYLDRNDIIHTEVIKGTGYRQYRVCKDCINK